MEGAGLQSGFVLAAVLGAVLFAGRLGGGDEVARRVFQVALGVLVAFLAISATTAFLRAPEASEALFGDSSGSSYNYESADGSSGSFDSGAQNNEQNEQFGYFEDAANRNAAATTAHAGAGIVALLVGLILLRRFRTLALGVALGGLLLILFGGTAGSGAPGDPSTAFLTAYTGLLGSAFGPARGLDIAHFVLMLGGTLALLLFGYTQFDAPDAAAESTSEI